MNKIEKRAKILAEMRELNEKAKAESRSFTEEETKAYAEKEAEVRKLTSEIEAEKREQALKGFSNDAPSARSDSQAENADGEQRKDFFTAEKRSGEIIMSVGGGGAALAPEEYLEELIKDFVCLLWVMWRDEDCVYATVWGILTDIFDESVSSDLVRVGHLLGVTDDSHEGDIIHFHSVSQEVGSQLPGFMRVCAEVYLIV